MSIPPGTWPASSSDSPSAAQLLRLLCGLGASSTQAALSEKPLDVLALEAFDYQVGGMCAGMRVCAKGAMCTWACVHQCICVCVSMRLGTALAQRASWGFQAMRACAPPLAALPPFVTLQGARFLIDRRTGVVYEQLPRNAARWPKPVAFFERPTLRSFAADAGTGAVLAGRVV